MVSRPLAPALALVLVAWNASAAAQERARVDPAMWEALERSPDGRALALVVLRAPELDGVADVDARREAVDAVQERVLAALAPDEVELRYRYETFAALTGRATRASVEVLAAHPDVLHVGVDARGGIALADSVPFIGADGVQALGWTGEGVTVAVLDTGIDTDHPDLADDLAPGAWHFLDEGATVGPGAEDGHGHGTHVSAIVTSGGVVGSVGVAPDADVLAVQVVDASGYGWLSDWAAGVDYVTGVSGSYAELAAINMSLGSGDTYTSCPCDAEDAGTALLAVAVQAAKDAGIATFAGSGNNGECGAMTAPACVSAAVAVAAVHTADEGAVDWGLCTDATTGPDVVACFSNKSGCNALAAPGVGIQAAWIGGGLETASGTSMAAPHVAGVAALLAEVNPTLEPDTVVALLEGTGVPTVEPCGDGPNPVRVDAWAAITSLVPGAEAVEVGFPPNPNVFTPGLSGPPIIAQVWDPVILHEAFVDDAVLDLMAISSLAANVPSPFGTILCAPPILAVVASQAPGVPFQVPIPAETAHLGLALVAQGASVDSGGGLALTNALQIRIGAY